MKRTFPLIICLYIFSFINPASAQDTLFRGRKYKIGFLAGNGIQYIGQLIGNKNHNIALKTTYYYQVNFYQLQYYRSILRHKIFDIDVLAQPQYNTVKYKQYKDSDDTPYLPGHEIGLNLGFLFRQNVANNALSFYMSISSGPHYLAATPVRQSNGFVFSNNLNAGINVRLHKNLYADIRAGIRHISNAGIKIPNAGINDMTMSEGVMIVL